jgi:adenosylhomocysteine nucleosidase
VTAILVLAAVDVEARGLARHLGLSRVAGGAGPHYRGGALEVACVGPGAARLEAGAAAWGPPALVVSAGTCGALAPTLRPGDLVVPEVVITETGCRRATARLPLARSGALLTVPAVAATAADKARLWLATGALAVDMESAPILAWAADRGVPAAVVRGIADAADAPVAPALAGLVAPDGRVRAASALRLMLREPRHVAGAIALGRGTAAALRAVAAALGALARGVPA